VAAGAVAATATAWIATAGAAAETEETELLRVGDATPALAWGELVACFGFGAFGVSGFAGSAVVTELELRFSATETPGTAADETPFP
jgi:hypothetical protein